MKKVKDFMTANEVMFCNPETKLYTVAKTMKENNLGALPVVDKFSKVIGIVTDRDLGLTLALKPTKNSPEKTVKDIVSHNKIYTVKTEDNLKKAMREMRTNKIGRLPVIDEAGVLKGTLSINTIISNSINKKGTLGKVSSSKENLARTITSILKRNNTKLNDNEGE